MKRRAMELFAVWLIAAALLIGCSTSRTSVSSNPPPPTREVLPNGLRLIVQEHRTAEVVAVQLWVGVGGRDEAPSERGFSHFAEHMLFKGTERLGPGFVDREVERVGGRTNAATSLDYTYYYMLLPSRRVERAVEVVADMAFNSTFDPTELGREREVVFEEVRVGEDNPRSFLVRRLYEQVFVGHPYGFPVLGDPVALRAASRETLRAYYKRHYVPSNMTLVVVGAVDPALVRSAALRAFGDATGGSFKRAALPPQPALAENRRQSIETAEGLALAYGRAETVWSLEEDRAYVARLNRVTREQIQEAARRYLAASYARLALVPKRPGS